MSLNFISTFHPAACYWILCNSFKQFVKWFVPDDTFKVHVILFTPLSLIFRDLYNLNVSYIYWKSRIVLLAYNWQPPHKLSTTNSVGITNIYIEVPNTCIDWVSHCYSERTELCFIGIKNERQDFSTRRKTRLVQKKIYIILQRLPNVDTYLYIPEAVGGVWFMNKAYILSPIKFIQTLGIPLNVGG